MLWMVIILDITALDRTIWMNYVMIILHFMSVKAQTFWLPGFRACQIWHHLRWIKLTLMSDSNLQPGSSCQTNKQLVRGIKKIELNKF